MYCKVGPDLWLLVTVAPDQGPLQTTWSDGQAGSKHCIAELTCKAESALSVLQPMCGACLCWG